MTPEQLAQLFHETYLRLATQQNKDVSIHSIDEQVILATCREILKNRVLLDRQARGRGMKYG